MKTGATLGEKNREIGWDSQEVAKLSGTWGLMGHDPAGQPGLACGLCALNMASGVTDMDKPPPRAPARGVRL